MNKKPLATHSNSVQLLGNWIAAIARLEMAKAGFFGVDIQSIKFAQQEADDACEALQIEVNKEAEE